MIRTLFWLADQLISLYIWAVILAALFSLLTAFGVLDTRNRVVWMIGDFFYRITEPALRPIRKTRTPFTSRTPRRTARRTAAKRSPASKARPAATIITKCGSIRRITT